MKSGFAAVLLSGALLNCALAAEVSPASSPATPHTEALRLIELMADRYGYKPEGRTQGAGARPFERFVKALDPERMILTEAELAAMASQRVQLDQAGDGKQLEAAQAVFATYLTRSTALYAHAQQMLLRDMKFTGHERFQRARANAAWEPDDIALRDLWRRRVMDDILKLRVAGSSPAHIVTTLQRRYERQLQRVRAMRSDEVASMYLNARVQYLDPHGVYFSPPPAPPERAGPELAGIGMVVQQQGDVVAVVELPARGPAQRSGAIGLGDRIVGIRQDADQQTTDVVGWRVDEVVALLRGLPGSTVELSILAQGAAPGSTPRRVSLTRARINPDDLRASGRLELVERGATGYRIGIVVVPTFYHDAAARRAGASDYASVTRDVAAALEKLKAQKADAILLDLRYNGGGNLDEAIGVSGLFLPGVPVVQEIDTERGLKVRNAPPGKAVWDGPLAILIDRGSAVATEIVAAAIQDHGRGLIIGETSFGRGSVQKLVSLDPLGFNPATQRGELRLTIGTVCRAGGEPIQGHGVHPDIVVPGRIGPALTDEANLMGRPACRIIAMTKRTEVATLLPALNKQHARRMKADLAYQKRLASRAQELATLASDEVSLNEAERRRTVESEPQEDITKLQLNHAMHIVADSLELSGKR